MEQLAIAERTRLIREKTRRMRAHTAVLVALAAQLKLQNDLREALEGVVTDDIRLGQGP